MEVSNKKKSPKKKVKDKNLRLKMKLYNLNNRFFRVNSNE